MTVLRVSITIKKIFLEYFLKDFEQKIHWSNHLSTKLQTVEYFDAYFLEEKANRNLSSHNPPLYFKLIFFIESKALIGVSKITQTGSSYLDKLLTTADLSILIHQISSILFKIVKLWKLVNNKESFLEKQSTFICSINLES